MILRAGGLHAASGALIAGELQQPLSPGDTAKELFSVVARQLFRDFERVKLYLLGPEALARLRAGQRLATISLGSPPEYDLTEQ